MPFIEESHPEHSPRLREAHNDGYAEGEWVTLRKVDQLIKEITDELGHIGNPYVLQFGTRLRVELGLERPSTITVA